MNTSHPNAEYPRTQLARALITALTHEDPEVRRSAERRVRAWNDVATGIADGSLNVGSRTPVGGLPAWVTLEVAQGGFATGRPAAGGPLLPHEEELAARHRLPANRRALFDHHLSETGLDELTALLDSGDYELPHPEQAALLTVAWLLRSGDAPAALRLLDVLDPFADTLCLTPSPVPGAGAADDGHTVHRATVGQVADRLRARAAHPRASIRARTQREALTVWAPFSDRVLDHWLATLGPDYRVDAHRPDGWAEGTAALLAEYEALAAEHTLCGKHRRPKENLAVLLAALREADAREDIAGDGTAREGGTVSELRLWGPLQYAVGSMLRKRGRPGTPKHKAVREAQAEQAAHPTHDRFARLLAARLNALPRHTGTPRVPDLLVPVTEAEAAEHGLPEAWPIPEHLRAAVLPATAAPLEELITAGIVPSAEVVAQIVPQLVARAEAESAPDSALTRLTAAHHQAFSRRRSLLLTDLSSQVRAEELPWVRALAPHRHDRDRRGAAARALLPRIGSAVLTAFPGTITPNPLVRQFTVLARSADLDLPFVEELAADIYTGTLSPKFLRAARVVDERTRGGLYARYYGLDAARLPALAEEAADPWSAARSLADLCDRRAGRPRGGVAASGMVIEQAQILTAHNLALLDDLGARPAQGWAGAAWDAYETVVRLLYRLPRDRGRLGHVKNAAFAWRQCVYFLSRCPQAGQQTALRRMAEGIDRFRYIREVLTPVLAGLRQAVEGSPPVEEEGRVHRFLGWSHRGHWVLRVLDESGTRR